METTTRVAGADDSPDPSLRRQPNTRSMACPRSGVSLRALTLIVSTLE